ncbi:MAG: hypothetical protein LAT55_01840 [Opitutales bacterium]|nr:hypothetical protein [Opitutales bacterium]
MDDAREQIEELSHALLEAMNPLRILLAGPYAFEADEAQDFASEVLEADVFILVIAREETPPEGFARAQKLQKEFGKEFPLQMLVGNPEQIVSRRETNTKWLEMVLEEGEVLYEAADYEDWMISTDEEEG